jgi:hypothetical protein
MLKATLLQISKFAKVKQLHKNKSLKCKRDNRLEDVLKGNIVSKALV